MHKTIRYESDVLEDPKRPGYCALIELHFDIIASSSDEAYAEIESAWDVSDKDNHVELVADSIPDKLLEEMQKHADDVAYDNAHEAWYEHCQAKAEAAYDSWKEGD